MAPSYGATYPVSRPASSALSNALLGGARGNLPPPPTGFVYLVGADGAYLVGADGAYLLGAA